MHNFSCTLDSCEKYKLDDWTPARQQKKVSLYNCFDVAHVYGSLGGNFPTEGTFSSPFQPPKTLRISPLTSTSNNNTHRQNASLAVGLGSFYHSSQLYKGVVFDKFLIECFQSMRRSRHSHKCNSQRFV